MKKLLSFGLIIVSFFFISSANAAVKIPLDVDSIASDTYIIGTHMFTEDRTYLSTEDIMWASRTIEASSRDDMIIYYKDLNNKWVNGVTGERITTPSVFQIEEVDKELVSLINISSVIDNATSVNLDQDLYTKSSLGIIGSKDIDYTLNFNAYNVEDQRATLNLVCSNVDDETDKLDLGVLPSYVDIVDGLFSFPIEISKDSLNGDYDCQMSVGNIESYINIYEKEISPQIQAEMMDVAYFNNEGFGGSIGLEPVIENTFSIYESEVFEQIDFYFSVIPKYFEVGNHTLDISMTKDGNLIELIDAPTNFNIVQIEDEDGVISPTPGYMIDFSIENTALEVGKYELKLTFDDEHDFYITILVAEKTEIEFEKLENKTEDIIYSDETKYLISDKKKSYTAYFNTKNIPDGTYNIDAILQNDNYEIIEDFTRNRSVEVKDNKFTFDFVIDKDFETNNYEMYLSLINDENVTIGETYFTYEIISNTETAIKILDSDLDYTDVLQRRDEVTGDAVIKLLAIVDKKYSGYELYSRDNGESEYVFVKDIADLLPTVEANIPVLGSKMFKIKPYIISDGVKVYGDDSNEISYDDHINNNELPSYPTTNRLTTARNDSLLSIDGTMTINFNASIGLNGLPTGYEIEISTDYGQTFNKVEEDIIDYTNLNLTNWGEQIIKSNNYGINLGESRLFRIRTYVISNGEKIYSNNQDVTYMVQNQGLEMKLEVDEKNQPIAYEDKNGTYFNASVLIFPYNNPDGFEIELMAQSSKILYNNIINEDKVSNNSYVEENIKLYIDDYKPNSGYAFTLKTHAEIDGEKRFMGYYSMYFNPTTG